MSDSLRLNLPSAHEGIVGSGEMAERIRAHDWSATPLGELHTWSPGILATINTMLASPIPTAIWWGPDYLSTYNDAYSILLWEKHPAALGASARVVWGEIWEAVGSQFLQVYTGGPSIQEKGLLLPLIKQGVRQDFYWDYCLSRVHVDNGLVGLLNPAHDDTEAVLAQQSLTRSQERLRIALSATGCIGMWDWHVQEDLVFADERFAMAYGADPKQVADKGMPIVEFLKGIHPDDLNHVHAAIVKSINTGADFLDEYRLLQKDGTERWVEARGRCLLNDDGLPWRFPGVAIDISRRKLAESAIAKGLIDMLPAKPHKSPDPSLPDTLSTLQALLTSRGHMDDLPVTASILDEDYLRSTNELISNDIGTRSEAGFENLSGMVDEQHSFASSALSMETNTNRVGTQHLASQDQKNLLYSLTLLLNDWVRAMLREDKELAKASKFVH